MNNQSQKKLNQLFNLFANETQASSFAVENLLNKTLNTIRHGEGNQSEKNDREL